MLEYIDIDYKPTDNDIVCEYMIERAEYVKEQGGEYVMIDIIPVGWTALQTLREENESMGLVLHSHRCMHAALTRNPVHGVSMQVIAKLARMVGLDQLHIGTAVGKMHGGRTCGQAGDRCCNGWRRAL